MEKDSIWSFEMEKGKEIQAGTLLLSEPFMFDENFKRTVILLTKVDEEFVSGLVINKPIQLPIRTVMEGFPLGFNPNLFLGGPVGTDIIQMIHTLGSKIDGSTRISEGIYWGGEFEQMKKYLRAGDISINQIKFFIGYSGWDRNQLTDELIGNSWIVSNANVGNIFSNNSNSLWKKIMLEMGGIYEQMANYPENPDLN